MKLLTQEQHDYLASVVKGKTSAECTEMLNNRYGLALSVEQVRYYKKNHKLNSGLTGRFEKGRIPSNKGKRPPEEILAKVKKSWFKKGRQAYNKKPVGSERIAVTGYVEVKVAEPNKWKQKHRVIWEEHYGKIPKGKLISFINGNSTDCRIDNLIMIDAKINAILNHKIKTKERPRELVEVVSDIVQIRNKLKELRKRNENNE